MLPTSRDTIAAIATPPGEGAVAIIRLSGPQAIELASHIFSGPVASYRSHTAHFGKILSASQEVIDEVLLLVMRAPRSYTGEDIVEIQSHGGLVAKRVLARTLEAGARAATPGEFTYRAFRNGKIDLAQAEAVQQLIGAKNELSAEAATAQLKGLLSETVRAFQNELVESAAILEAWVDFPEEDLAFASFETIIEHLETIRGKIKQLEETFFDGRVIHEGLTLCLSGSPNVGKSSLMNALLGKERAIVTPLAGTTRDLIEEDLRLSGLHFRLIDTAGIRHTDEPIEQEGIRRSQKAFEEADLILLVLDATRPLSDEDRVLLDRAPKEKTLLVWNKIDLPHQVTPIEGLNQVALSAKTREGLETLKTTLNQLIWKKGPPDKGEVILTSQRHREALRHCTDALSQVIDGLKGKVSPEFVSADMRAALTALSTIIGTDITEDILNAIFSKFCLGK